MINKEVKSPQEILDDIRRLAAEAPNELGRAAYTTLNIVMNESKPICPIKKGYLRGSGYVDDPIIGEGSVSVSFGYSAEYAIYVHEDLTKYHNPPTQAKFLEIPLWRHLSEGRLWIDIIERVDKILEAS